MIIVKLMGGLGNQMFQYAAGRCLSYLHKTDLKLDLAFLNTDSQNKYTHFVLLRKSFYRPGDTWVQCPGSYSL